jgi:hypothetical protein
MKDDVLPEDLRALTEKRAVPCVSITMTTVPAGGNIREDTIKLKDLLRGAEERLIADGFRPTLARDMLQPGHELLTDPMFWQHGEHGVVLYFATGLFRSFYLREPVDDQVYVSNHFHLKPLLRRFGNDGLSYDEARTRFEQLAGTDLVVYDVKEAVEAAVEGRVDTLFVAKEEERWGALDEATNTVAEHDVEQPGDDDLLDLAAVHTILNSGHAFVVPPEAIPGKHGPVTAILRY